MVDKKFTAWMYLSWLIPVLGGIIAYYFKKSEDEELAGILLIGSLTLPLQILIILTLGGLFYIPTIIVMVYVFRRFTDNYYSGLLWPFYLGIIGAFYAYYRTYSEDPAVKHTISWFALLQAGTVILIRMVIASIYAQQASTISDPNMSQTG